MSFVFLPLKKAIPWKHAPKNVHHATQIFIKVNNNLSGIWMTCSFVVSYMAICITSSLLIRLLPFFIRNFLRSDVWKVFFPLLFLGKRSFDKWWSVYPCTVIWRYKTSWGSGKIIKLSFNAKTLEASLEKCVKMDTWTAFRLFDIRYASRILDFITRPLRWNKC